MSHPYPSDAHIDSTLSTFSMGYRPNRFIADKIVPIITVAKKSDKYFLHGAEEFDNINTLRAPRSPYQRIQHTYSNTTYSCAEHGLEDPIDPDTVANADAPLQPAQDASKKVLRTLLLRKEIEVMTEITSTTPPTTSNALSGSDRWDDPNSDPLGQIDDDRDAIRSYLGEEPNALVLGPAVWKKIKRHPQILNAIKGGATVSNPAKVTKELLAEIFEVKQVIVGGAIYNQSKQGQTASFTDVWGKIALLLYVPEEAPGIEDTVFAAQFIWNYGEGGTPGMQAIAAAAREAAQVDNGASLMPIISERYFENAVRADVVRNRFYSDVKVTGQGFAALRTTVVD